MATADLWVYNAENLCVSFFYQVTFIFHLRGGKIQKKFFLGLPTVHFLSLSTITAPLLCSSFKLAIIYSYLKLTNSIVFNIRYQSSFDLARIIYLLVPYLFHWEWIFHSNLSKPFIKFWSDWPWEIIWNICAAFWILDSSRHFWPILRQDENWQKKLKTKNF